MTTREAFIRGVDALIAARKGLAGLDLPLTWPSARDGIGVETKLPVDVGGTQYGDKLTVVAVPTLGTFHINLLHLGLCVSRLDFDPMQPHTNTALASLDGLPGIVSGRHFHKWAINTRFVQADGSLERLFHAEELPTSIHKFDQALRWFCSELNIELPHGHSIDYPGDLI
jgi:hypothetical protein